MKDINIIKIIAQNIHDIRIKKNISLQELSERTGIDINVIRKLGSGEPNQGIPTFIKLAEGLGVDYREITKGINFVED